MATESLVLHVAVLLLAALEVYAGIAARRATVDFPTSRVLSQLLFFHAAGSVALAGHGILVDPLIGLRPPFYWFVLGWMINAFVPGALTLFGLEFPETESNTTGSARRRLIAYGPSAALALLGLVALTLHYTTFVPASQLLLPALSLMILLVAIYMGTGLLLVLRRMNHQARMHPSPVIQQRAKMIGTRVIRPSIVGAAFAIIAVLVVVLLPGGLSGGVLIMTYVGVAGLFFLPCAGLSFGVLRYRAPAADAALRRLSSPSVIMAISLAAFFLVTEVAEMIVANRTRSALLGLVGAAVFSLAAIPLRRRVDAYIKKRLGAGAAPEARGREIYQATLEDLVTDGLLSDRDKRVLAQLAQNLNLSPEDTARLGNPPASSRPGA